MSRLPARGDSIGRESVNNKQMTIERAIKECLMRVDPMSDSAKKGFAVSWFTADLRPAMCRRLECRRGDAVQCGLSRTTTF